MTKRVLHLNVKKVYFEQIKSGEKTNEFRLQNDYWRKRLNRSYDEIHIKMGYPKSGDMSRTLVRPWLGFSLMKIEHEHFGEGSVDVFAIKVN